MPTHCKPGPTLRKQHVILTPLAWTHPARPLGSSLECKNLSSGTGRCRRLQACQACGSRRPWAAAAGVSCSLSPPGGCSGRWWRPSLPLWCVSPQAKLIVLTRAPPGPWSAHVPVRLRHSARSTQHKWATEIARTKGKSLCSAQLLPPGNVATKVQVSSTVRQAASLLGMLLETLTGARRYSCRTFKATRAMYLASCGIDVWRIQLHGCWRSCAVLRCVRLSLVAQSLSRVASLGKAVQKQIWAAKAELVQLQASCSLPEIQKSSPALTGWATSVHGRGIGKTISR